MIKSLTRAEISSYLFEKLSIFEPWPPKVVAIPAMIAGTAFFPGGAGLWLEEESTYFPDIMILGQDFSTRDQHMAMLLGRERDIDSPTWRNFMQFAAQAGLDLKRCFFTNALMGLRDGGSSQGPNPGYKKRNKLFVQRSHEFLRMQFETIQPKLTVVLGMPAAQVLSDCSSDLIRWKKCTYREMDERKAAFIANAAIPDVRTSFVSLVHPSYRGLNVAMRRYKGLEGNDAEVALLRDAIAVSL